MAMVDPTNPLKCYCGKATKIYDSLFRRNFCSDECSTALRLFLGGTDKTVEIVKEVLAGDFRIRGSTVVLNETLAQHQAAKAASIDKIDVQVQAQLKQDQLKAEMKRKFPNMPEAVIEAMLKAKG